MILHIPNFLRIPFRPVPPLPADLRHRNRRGQFAKGQHPAINRSRAGVNAQLVAYVASTTLEQRRAETEAFWAVARSLR